MSTKSTIYYEDGDLHIYNEAFDDENIYIDRETSGMDITISLPVAAVVAITNYGNRLLKRHRYIAGMSDSDIESGVADAVDERIADFKSGHRFAAIMGLSTFGGVDLPREEQIANGIKSRMENREMSRAMLDKLLAAARETEGGEHD